MSEPTPGQQIYDRRVALGLTQSQAQRDAGISRTSWCDLEKGSRTNPRPETCQGVDRALRWEPGSTWRLFHGHTPNPTEAAAAPISAPTSTERSAGWWEDEGLRFLTFVAAVAASNYIKAPTLPGNRESLSTVARAWEHTFGEWMKKNQ